MAGIFLFLTDAAAELTVDRVDDFGIVDPEVVVAGAGKLQRHFLFEGIFQHFAVVVVNTFIGTVGNISQIEDHVEIFRGKYLQCFAEVMDTPVIFTVIGLDISYDADPQQGFSVAHDFFLFLRLKSLLMRRMIFSS